MWFCFGFLIAGTGLQRKLNLPSMSYWTLKPELLDKGVISSLEATEHWERQASIMQSGRGESLREKNLQHSGILGRAGSCRDIKHRLLQGYSKETSWETREQRVEFPAVQEAALLLGGKPCKGYEDTVDRVNLLPSVSFLFSHCQASVLLKCSNPSLQSQVTASCAMSARAEPAG